jgi:hypothetical protein
MVGVRFPEVIPTIGPEYGVEVAGSIAGLFWFWAIGSSLTIFLMMSGTEFKSTAKPVSTQWFDLFWTQGPALTAVPAVTAMIAIARVVAIQALI